MATATYDRLVLRVVSQQKVIHPHFTFCVPCSNITEMRKAYKDAFLKKHNIKLGFMSAFVKAAAYALADQPAVNGGTDSRLTFYAR